MDPPRAPDGRLRPAAEWLAECAVWGPRTSAREPTWRRLGFPSYRAWLMDYNRLRRAGERKAYADALAAVEAVDEAWAAVRLAHERVARAKVVYGPPA